MLPNVGELDQVQVNLVRERNDARASSLVVVVVVVVVVVNVVVVVLCEAFGVGVPTVAKFFGFLLLPLFLSLAELPLSFSFSFSFTIAIFFIHPKLLPPNLRLSQFFLLFLQIFLVLQNRRVQPDEIGHCANAVVVHDGDRQEGPFDAPQRN